MVMTTMMVAMMVAMTTILMAMMLATARGSRTSRCG